MTAPSPSVAEAPTAQADAQTLPVALYLFAQVTPPPAVATATVGASINRFAPELDAEDFVIAYLAQQLPVDATISARMPAQLPLPFVLVRRIAGGDDWLVDHATVQIDNFDSTQTRASTLARQVHHVMRQLDAKVVVDVPDHGRANIYSCYTDQTPIWMPYEPSGGAAAEIRYVSRYIVNIRLPAIPNF